MKITLSRIFIILLFIELYSPILGQNDSILQTVQDSVEVDSLQLESLIEQLNAQTREEWAKDSSVLTLADSGFMLAERLMDTSQLVSMIWRKASWYWDNDQKTVGDSLEDLRRVILAKRGYILKEELQENEDLVAYAYNTLRRTLQVFVDSSGTISFDTIVSPSFQHHFVKNDYIWAKEQVDSANTYWVKIRLKGDGKSYRKHLLLPNGEVGAEDTYWQYVEFYRPTRSGLWQKHIGGATTPIEQRMTKDWHDFFELEVGPDDNYFVYFRLQGFKAVNSPSGIHFRHLHASYLDRQNNFRVQVFAFTSILIFQLFFFFFWYLATRQKTFLPYLIYILGIAAFALSSIQFNFWFPNPDFERGFISLVLLFAFSWLAGVGLIEFTKGYLDTKNIVPIWHKVLTIFNFIFGFAASVIVIPVVLLVLNVISPEGWHSFALNEIVNSTILIYVFLFPLGLLFISVVGYITWKRNFSPAKYYLLGIGFLLVGIIILILMLTSGSLDNMLSYEGSILMTQIGIILQLCVFALGMGSKRKMLEAEKTNAQEKFVETQAQLLAEQQKVNTAFGRFVPHKFLEAIGRNSVLDIKLGDGVEQEVTVFFSDIRGYTRLAESMQPKENFSFLNGYLGRLGPIISDHNGFVNQYYGDGIMAIFMQNPSNALQASINIQQKLRNYNEERVAKGRVPIQIGIGMHTGPLIMGIIGDTLRMEAGVVSDTVNTAARMEGLTKHFGANILVSETVFNEIEQKQDYAFRYLGKVQVKGRNEPLKVFDFFDGDSPEIKLQKLKSLEDFEKGVEAYYAQDFAAAATAFDQVILQHPDDKSALNYLEKSKKYLLQGISKDWTGVEEIQVK